MIITVHLDANSSASNSVGLALAAALSVGSCLRERYRETDSFTTLALHSFNHSVIQSQIGLLSSTDSHSSATTGSHF